MILVLVVVVFAVSVGFIFSDWLDALGEGDNKQ